MSEALSPDAERVSLAYEKMCRAVKAFDPTLAGFVFTAELAPDVFKAILAAPEARYMVTSAGLTKPRRLFACEIVHVDDGKPSRFIARRSGGFTITKPERDNGLFEDRPNNSVEYEGPQEFTVLIPDGAPE